MKMNVLLVLIVGILLPASVWAVPGLISYQGRLTDPEGQPIAGSVTITFTFWSAQAGGTQLGSGFSDADTVTPDAEGVYSTLIGDDPSPAIPSAIFESNTVWLNVNVNGENLTPRKRVSSVGYAVQSANADTLDGSHKESFANATHTHNAFDIDSGTFAPYLIPDSLTLTSSSFIHGEAIRTGTVSQSYIDQAIARDSEIMPNVLANDGSGSTLDADTLDGQQSTAFAATEHTHTGYAASSHQHSGADITSGMISETTIPMTITRDSEIVTQVLANDGAGSGIDADKLDGLQATAFAESAHVHSGADITTGTIADGRIPGAIARDSEILSTVLAGDGAGSTLDADTLDGQQATAFAASSHAHSGAQITSGTVAEARIDSTIARDSEIMTTVLANDGSSSGLNADLLDSKHASDFLDVSSSGVRISGEYSSQALYVQNTKSGVRGIDCYATETSTVGIRSKSGMYDFYAWGTGTYAPFTGSHEVRLAVNFPVSATPGLVVCTMGPSLKCTDDKGGISISTTMPTVRLADTPQDKTVFGVLEQETQLMDDHWYKPAKGERFASVNALGDGRVWVCTANGEIAMGDYLTTSSVPGYAQKQNDDLQHNYTVGKVTESVDWSAVTDTLEFGGQTYKVYLIAVVYTCG